MPAGRWTLQAFARGYQAGSASGVVVTEGEATDGLELRLSRGAVLSGRVVESRSARPIPDATVRAELSGRGGARRMIGVLGEGSNEATTDAEGRYEIAGLAPGGWTVTASHADWCETRASVEVKDGPATLELRLGRGAAVAGGVVAAGRPVAGAQVTLVPAGDSGLRPSAGLAAGGEQSALSDEGGRFRFDRLAAGRYTLTASLREQASAPADAVVTGEGVQEVQLVLGEGALLRGTVSGLPDAQLAGVSVSARGRDYFADTRSGPGGGFEFAGVPEGLVTVSARAGDFMTSTRNASATVTIAAGQAEAAVEIRFRQGFRVDGHVTRGGNPVAQAGVSAYAESGNLRGASASTDESGAFALEGLDQGRYRLTAIAGGTPVTRTLDLTGDASVEIEALPPGSYELRAESSGYATSVRRGVAVPSHGVQLRLTPGGALEIQVGPQTLGLPQPEGVLLAADGRPCVWNPFTADGKIRFNGPLRTLENLAPGAYTLRAGGASREVTVSEGGRWWRCPRRGRRHRARRTAIRSEA